MRKIAVVFLMDKNHPPMYATDQFRYEETPNGILLLHGKSAQLIPWHLILRVEYARE